MNLDNFVVRSKREHVERFAKPESWAVLMQDDLHELATEVAPLHSDVEAEEEEAKRFDLLMLNLQLSVLRYETQFTNRAIGSSPSHSCSKSRPTFRWLGNS
jgi:type I restriction enzyme R subunit